MQTLADELAQSGIRRTASTRARHAPTCAHRLPVEDPAHLKSRGRRAARALAARARQRATTGQAFNHGDDPWTLLAAGEPLAAG